MLYERWDTTSLKNEEAKMIVETIIKHIKVEPDFVKLHNIMLKDGRIIGLNKYAKMIEEGEVSRNDAYTFIFIFSEESMLGFQYPFLYYSYTLLESYISKMGLYYYNTHIGYCSAPATSVRYTAIYTEYEEYSTIEVVDLEEVAKNTKVNDILKNYAEWIAFNDRTYWEIFEKYASQPLFDRYDFNEAESILRNYYNGDKPLAKKVAKITINYSKIFRPYKVCFETKTWNQIECSTIKFQEWSTNLTL